MQKALIDRVAAATLAMFAVLGGACDSDSATTANPVCPPGQAPVCPPATACSCQPLMVAGTSAGAGGASGVGGASGFGGQGVTSGVAGTSAGRGAAGLGAGGAGGGAAGMMGSSARGRGMGGAGGSAGSAGAGAAGSGGSSGTVGQGSDGCSDTPVAGLTLSEVAVYQSVKIPVMKNMAAVAVDARNADVVQNRDAIFRIHVTPQTGWMPRQVSARVELTDAAGGASKRFFATLMPTQASTDENADSAFRVKVPAAAMTGDARFSVSLVECGAGATMGAAMGARFPADGATELGARKTGVLKVHLLPLTTGGRMPEITQEIQDAYKKRLMAMYPITGVEFTVGPPLASSATSMCSHLTAIRTRRMSDRAAIDVYYYGLTNGLSGGQAGCSTATPNANSSAKTAAGWVNATGGNGGIEGAAATVTHEIGHSHGRLHAPCMVQDPDRNYPYRNADVGVWGYDSRSDKYLPPTRKDMMGYCPNPDRSGAWLSDYTYQALVERVAGVNALVPAAQPLVLGPASPWEQLVVDSVGSHWGEEPLMMHDAPEGQALTAIVHEDGGTTQSIQVFKEDLEDGVSHNAFLLTLPGRQPSWRSLEVPGLLAPLAFPGK